MFNKNVGTTQCNRKRKQDFKEPNPKKMRITEPISLQKSLVLYNPSNSDSNFDTITIKPFHLTYHPRTDSHFLNDLRGFVHDVQCKAIVPYVPHESFFAKMRNSNVSLCTDEKRSNNREYCVNSKNDRSVMEIED